MDKRLGQSLRSFAPPDGQRPVPMWASPRERCHSSCLESGYGELGRGATGMRAAHVAREAGRPVVRWQRRGCRCPPGAWRRC